jgi:hypothetical protein
LLSETAKVAEEGKKKREEMKLKLADNDKMGKYTLCADRPASAPTQASSSGSMVFSPTPLHVLELAPAKHTKTGLAKKMNAKSHYTTEHYAPAKAEKPVAEAKPKTWALSYSGPADHEEVPEMPKQKQDKKLAGVASHYDVKKYTPKRGEKPTPKAKESKEWSLTDIKPMEMSKNADDLAAEAKADWNSTMVKQTKLADVESSGYGVISPVPSIEAKVHAAKSRSTASMMLSSDFKLKQAETESKRAVATVGIENQAPVAEKLGRDGANLINSLLNRASSIDQRAAKSPAHSQKIGVMPAVEGDGETTAL